MDIMKRKLLLLLTFPLSCLAQIPAYYSSIDFSQTGDELKEELSILITDTHIYELQYTPEVWDALKQADLDPDNLQNVLLIYGYNDNDAIVSNDRTRDKDLSCHTSSCTGKWVREHVYPRSLGNPNLEFAGPGSDAHHLRAIDSQMNNSRSNRRFADGSGNAAVLSNGYFYPGDEWRGDVARMMMYMYVRYQDQCLPVVVGTGNTDYSFFGDMPDIFLEWNAEDPVNAYEMNRNTVLQNMQGNRNPFIDNPYLATIIWNGPQAQDKWGLLAATTHTGAEIIVYPTVTTGIVYIENYVSENYDINVYNNLGQLVQFAVSGNTLDLTSNSKGMYYMVLSEASSSKTFKIILN